MSMALLVPLLFPLPSGDYFNVLLQESMLQKGSNVACLDRLISTSGSKDYVYRSNQRGCVEAEVCATAAVLRADL